MEPDRSISLDNEDDVFARQELNTLKKQYNHLLEKFHEIQEKNMRLKQEKKHFQKQIKQLTADNERTNDNNDFWTDQSYESSIYDIPKDDQSMKTEIIRLQGVLEEDSIREQALLHEIENKDKKIVDLEEQNKHLRCEITELKNVSSYTEQIAQLRSENNEINSKYNAAKETLLNLTAQNDFNRQECIKLRKKLQNANITNKDLLNKADIFHTAQKQLVHNEFTNVELQTKIDLLQLQLEQAQQLNDRIPEFERKQRELQCQNKILLEQNDSILQQKFPESQQEQNLYHNDYSKDEVDSCLYLTHLLLERKYMPEYVECSKEMLLDVISTFQTQIEENNFNFQRLLNDRNQLKRSSTTINRELKEIRAKLRVYERRLQDSISNSEHKETIALIEKKFNDSEAFKKKVLKKIKEVTSENAELKIQINALKQDNSRLQYKLADFTDQLMQQAQ